MEVISFDARLRYSSYTGQAGTQFLFQFQGGQGDYLVSFADNGVGAGYDRIAVLGYKQCQFGPLGQKDTWSESAHVKNGPGCHHPVG